MTKESMWKRAVRRGVESQRREPRECDFEQACELSAFVSSQLHRELANGEELSAAELNRRLSLHLSERARLERKMADSWRQVQVTVRE